MGVVHHARMLGAACAALVGLATEAPAQTPEEFYKGKTVEFIMGYATGGSNDAYSRLIANHLGKHIPGNPTVVPNNMPGAGSFLAVNRIYAVSPKDGTVVGLGAPTMAIDEKLGNPGVRFKASELNWVRRVDSLINTIMMWKASPVKTVADAQKMQSNLATTVCVPASAVDAYSSGFHVSLVQECTFDRAELTHKVNSSTCTTKIWT